MVTEIWYRHKNGYTMLPDRPGKFPDDWQQVTVTYNPTPQTEEVEVKRWECKACGHIQKQKEKSWMDVDIACPCHDLIELTGHYTRHVKRKVRRREELAEVNLNGTDFVYLNPQCFPQLKGKSIDIFAEWEEDEP